MRTVRLPRSRSSVSPRAAERGFTVTEVLIASLIMVEILVAAGILFDLHNKTARVQAQITEMQQSLRVAQYDLVRSLRLAGRGSIPGGRAIAGVFTGTAITVRNNVDPDATTPEDREVAVGFAGSPTALPGTDILTVRGCLSGEMYQTNQVADFDSAAQTIRLTNPSLVGIEQSLERLAQQAALTDPPTFTGMIALTSPVSRSVYAVASITGLISIEGDADDPSALTLQLDLATDNGLGLYAGGMAVALACILEEYRYYIREEYEIPGDTSSRLRARLTRAQMEPGTELPFRGQLANLSLDLADDIVDLQVALGFDSDYPSASDTEVGAMDDDDDTLGNDDLVFEGATDETRDTDDWLFNSTADNPLDDEWAAHTFDDPPITNSGPVDLLYARITTIARTRMPDRDYAGPALMGRLDPGLGDLVEDHEYDVAPSSNLKQGDDAKHRRRSLVTVVDLRNS